MTVYSVTNEIPVRENGCTELPPNSYGLSKLIAENLTKYYSKENNFKAIIIRIQVFLVVTEKVDLFIMPLKKFLKI